MSNSNNQLTPPAWPLRLLRNFLKPHYLEEIQGDMEERFQDNLERYNIKKARRQPLII
ncbi:MAG: permease prefix domain 2-containing transporter [Bacteroidota bacterium]|nr:permease prefix domain 2-containing transporter [Bacteroidota bacterium]